MIYFENYIIRPLEISDLKPYFDLVERNRRRLEDFFVGTVSRTSNLSETDFFLTELISKRAAKQYYPFVLIDNSVDEFAAFIDLKNLDWTIPKTEIGFFTDEKFTGKGLTKKALNFFLDYCFETFEFKKIFLRTHYTNKPTQAIAEKCGFVKEGIIRMDYKTTSGEIVDLIYYGILNNK